MTIMTILTYSYVPFSPPVSISIQPQQKESIGTHIRQVNKGKGYGSVKSCYLCLVNFNKAVPHCEWRF